MKNTIRTGLAAVTVGFLATPAFAGGISGKADSIPGGRGIKDGDLGDGTRAVRVAYAPSKENPPGWRKGNKTGWDGKGVPPGQAKKDNDRYDDRNWRPSDRDRDNGSNYYSRSLTGVVTRTTGTFDRKIRVRLSSGEERTVDTSRGVTVVRAGRNISIHDIRSGERVRLEVDRYTSGGDLQARRIEVLSTSRTSPWYDRDARRDEGRNVSLSTTIRNMDERNQQFRVQDNGRTVTVYADRASLMDRRGRIAFRDLDNGDRVTIQGQRVGDRIYASRITLR